MSRVGRVWVVATLVGGLLGCTAILGDDFVADTGTGATGTGAGGGSGGGTGAGGQSGACDLATQRCVPSPGGGWSEPFAVVERSLGCGGAFPLERQSLLDDLQVGAASCGCACGQPAVTCPSTMTVIGFAQPSCASGQGQNSLPPNTCYNKLATSASHQLVVPNPIATCATGSVAATFPPATWGTELLACGTAAVGACSQAADVCLPEPAAPFEGALCIAQAGVVACPPPYQGGTTFFGGLSDDRSCPATCSCQAIAARCEVTASTFFGSNCTNLAGTGTVQSGSPLCTLNGTINSLRPATPAVSAPGSCLGVGPSPGGGVTPAEPATVCCLP